MSPSQSEWLELESDPGIFTLLLKDMQILGVEVEEVYDLNTPITEHVHGFIFLFKWRKEKKSGSRSGGEDVLYDASSYSKTLLNSESFFFAKQIVENSCATHALISIALNCLDTSQSELLASLKRDTKGLSPEEKGKAIGRVEELAHAHNKYANSTDAPANALPHIYPKVASINEYSDSFHYVSFFPFNGELVEVDGLKPYPISHGRITRQNWTASLFNVIQRRIRDICSDDSDIRFSLMSIIDEKLTLHKKKLASGIQDCANILEKLPAFLEAKHYEVYEVFFKKQILHVDANNDLHFLKDVCIVDFLYNTCNVLTPRSFKTWRHILLEICRHSCMKKNAESGLASSDSCLSKLCEGDGNSVVFLLLTDNQFSESESELDLDLNLMNSLSAFSFDLTDSSTLTHSILSMFLSLLTVNLSVQEEACKHKRYHIDAERRNHNYFPFFKTFLSMLAEQTLLSPFLDSNFNNKYLKCQSKKSYLICKKIKKKIQKQKKHPKK